MQRKPLPRPPKNNAQVKEYTSAVKRGLSGYYVSPSDNGWSVRKASATRASGKFATKTEAISHAKKTARSQADIIVYSKNGSVTLIELKTTRRSPSS
jgi:hypothetical protein